MTISYKSMGILILLGLSFCIANESLAKRASLSYKNSETAQVLSPDAEMKRILRHLIQANALDIPEAVVEASSVQNTKVINAYTDGRKIIMTSSLWDALKSEDARAFVLGHELGHITRHHLSHGALRRSGFAILGSILTIVTNNPLATYGTEVGSQLLDLKFGRGQEYQADEAGIQYLIGAHYNKNAAIDVFKVLRLNQETRQVEFLVTHPLPDSRIKRVIEKYELDPSGMLARKFEE
ncbi:MAG: M48 family metalloprotease [Vampirovibrio sp.]